ncbi:MAG: hypothetical protein A2622_00085 [Bdellovibrionales bacterium RIFCSPHIGHO2_01_FULL_40_29]|nr:MAG: hypothetical protein A2622_00085 [Bdellovibrionales bacterium RIFCSPHIGHO2_01_FULL_40_29]OFZ32526.1 MAG: hypothetical protein A3D17_04685 [Bdellovibrionales bacterium RIFCSPHIGHO2_02_FULL_40_15]
MSSRQYIIAILMLAFTLGMMNIAWSAPSCGGHLCTPEELDGFESWDDFNVMTINCSEGPRSLTIIEKNGYYTLIFKPQSSSKHIAEVKLKGDSLPDSDYLHRLVCE